MKYYYLENDICEKDELYFLSIYNNIETIREHKEDVIYKSSIPRLKQSTIRGIQAFKQLLKRFDCTKYDESIKLLWLTCFKLVYNFDCYSLNINGIKSIIFNKDISKEKLQDLIKLNNYVYTAIEPNKLNCKNENMIYIATNYIINEGLTKDEIIETFIKLMKIVK